MPHCQLVSRRACTVKATVGRRSGEAMAHGLVSKALVSELFLVVALTMALTPFLADLGARLGKKFESSDFKARTSSTTP